MSRVLKAGNNRITNSYANHTGWSKGVDVVKDFNGMGTTETIVAHSTGKVIKVIDYMKGKGQLDNESMGYGNYVMILHNEKYQSKHVVTLYAHLDNVNIGISEGYVYEKGTELGYMGSTGGSYGAHLHFEVRLYDEVPNATSLHDTSKFEWIDPTPYLDTDLPTDVKELDEGSYPNYAEGSGKYYRVRKAFTDYKSSKGSYSKWSNAFNRWKAYKNEGYHIYDNEGNQLDVEVKEDKPMLTASSYPNYASNSSDYYRIRTSFDNAKSSKGSYHNFGSAFAVWKAQADYGYHIYDKDGKQLD